MAERPAATAPEMAGPESAGPVLGGWSTLLLTKLHPPGPRPDFLPRPRLAERLDEALSRGLVLVCAPAGYGKTSLLASRADPPLGLARLRARGQLTELRDAELRFTADEAAAFLRETAGADLPDTAVAALTARTEGWAAGLQLAALSMRGQPDIDRFVAAFTGSHRFVP